MVHEFELGGEVILPGQRKLIRLSMPSLFDCTELGIPVHVIRGKKPGPTLFVCAAIHGDEINGVAACRKLLRKKVLAKLKGTLLVIPIVNVFGFNSAVRYLPDRKDLNRVFPGSLKGSLASRMAHIFMNEVVKKCDYGIDLHTGAIHRSNYPHIRVSFQRPLMKKLAASFGAKVILDSKLRDGSLRQAAYEAGTPVLLFEGGQALRFEKKVIDVAVTGILNVMSHLKMLPTQEKVGSTPVVAKSSGWIRATRSGVFMPSKKLGDIVHKGEIIGKISDLLNDKSYLVKSKYEGLVLGISNLPLVNEGDAILNIASAKNIKEFADDFVYNDFL